MNETAKLDTLNIGLMILSCIIAFFIPFELFLFSYAILGPLHYLTEISWLHQRNYFTKGKYDFLWLLLLVLFGTFSYLGFQQFDKVAKMAPYLGFLSALAFYLLKDWYLKGLAILLIIISFTLISKGEFYSIFFLIFLPTLIHVFIFTGLFILFGALKSKSVTGILSLVVFVACALSFFFINFTDTNYVIGEYVRGSYKDFSIVNHVFMNQLNLGDFGRIDPTDSSRIFDTSIGVTVMRFIAFAYTYHYLNWFSKTSIIQWHKVDKKYLVATILLWLSSIALYAYNYHTGLKFLFFLSLLHVFLEFPLNFKSIIGIYQEIKNWIFVPKVPSSSKVKVK
jgi:hypothetical protein